MRTNINRAASLLLALVLAFSLAVPALAAGGPLQAAAFSDVQPGEWYYSDVTECARLGVVSGFEDGTFRPEDPVTDIQFIVMLTRTFYNDKVESAKKNADGKPWYWPNTSVADDTNLSVGLTLSDNAMNRYDMAKALYNNISIEDGLSGVTNAQLIAAKAEITDWDSVPSNRRAAVNYCYALGILTGMTDGTFSGEQSMTRAQACAVIMRMRKLLNTGDPGQSQDNQDSQSSQTPGTLANGQPITEANVLAILDEIQLEYPTGTVWGGYNTPGNHYYADGGKPKTDMADLNVKFRSASVNGAGLSSLNYGCGGWACMITERIFGQTGFPFREVTDTSKVRPGDVIISVNNKGQLVHYSIVSSSVTSTIIDGTTQWQFSCCHGNSTRTDNIGRVYWEETVTSSRLTSNIRCFTRYPETETP